MERCYRLIGLIVLCTPVRLINDLVHMLNLAGLLLRPYRCLPMPGVQLFKSSMGSGAIAVTARAPPQMLAGGMASSASTVARSAAWKGH